VGACSAGNRPHNTDATPPGFSKDPDATDPVSDDRNSNPLPAPILDADAAAEVDVVSAASIRRP
jgi:hypothetical protein